MHAWDQNMGHCTILLVDDDKAFRQYLTHFLSSIGYQVEPADSGSAALALLDGGLAPDLVLLDLVMPDMGGLEVLARFKEIMPSVPVVILSGVGQVKTVVEAISLGASDYLSKPFEDQALQLTIASVLEKQALREKVRVQAVGFDQERARIIRELSTPVLQVREQLLILPIIGVIDPQRARQITEQLLQGIRMHRAKVAVIDITGVPEIDESVANHLVQTVDASRLMGATVIVTGLSAKLATTLVTLGVDLSTMKTIGDLQGGIEEAERLLKR
jgi:CheY-like chemotaxis protein/anti-anti-sigma regulatory factor